MSVYELALFVLVLMPVIGCLLESGPQVVVS